MVFVFQDGMEVVKNSSGPGILNNIPSTLCRWIEECRVLDSSSVHDVITGLSVCLPSSILYGSSEGLSVSRILLPFMMRIRLLN